MIHFTCDGCHASLQIGELLPQATLKGMFKQRAISFRIFFLELSICRRQLYDVEERGKTLNAAERRQSRQRDAVPIWNRARRWLDSDAVKQVLPRSRMGEALGYLRNQWSALAVYLGDGKIPIDNTQSEQTIRPLTVGRNHWQFLGHPRAAAGRWQLYSVVTRAVWLPASAAALNLPRRNRRSRRAWQALAIRPPPPVRL